MEKHIMLAFVSTVNQRVIDNKTLITYSDIQGRQYAAIQTNESAIVYVERMLEAKGESLSKIFLIASSAVRGTETKGLLHNTDFGDVTHLEFLKLRVAKEFPQLADKFSEHDYLEKGDDVHFLLEKNISQTAEIANAVMKFAQENHDDKIKVHADMTGGFRHASMLMLSIIQLLKYRGVEIGEILYSDPDAQGKPPKPKVYPVNEIQRMFSLITGADEFVNFGSVRALNEYFGKNPPAAVKALLEAMEKFSDAIKICRTSAIEDELKNLGQHIKTFREHPDKDLRSELFAKIIDTVEREYGNLISDNPSRIKIIEWCMNKGFWQQAMTLCTEWLPEEFITRKICAPIDPGIEDTCTSKGKAAHKTWQNYFIIDYAPPSKANEKKTFCCNLRNALKSENRKFSIALVPELKNFWDEYDSDFGRRAFERCKRQESAIPKFKEKFPMLAAVLQMLSAKPDKNSTNYNQIPKYMSEKLSNDELWELFKGESEQPAPDEKSEDPWENREQIYRKLFASKIIDLKPDPETALKYLKDYFEIRRERNQINHAGQHSTKSIDELSDMINKCLDALKKMPAS